MLDYAVFVNDDGIFCHGGWRCVVVAGLIVMRSRFREGEEARKEGSALQTHRWGAKAMK